MGETERVGVESSETLRVGPRLEISFIEAPHDFLKGFNVVFDLSVMAEVTVGRSPDNILVIPDPTVSRRHAVLSYSSGKVIIRDLGSTNGTYVLEGNTFKRVTEHVFDDEAIVRLGLYTMLRLTLKK